MAACVWIDIDPVVIDMEEPNGLAFSPDESTLYVSDTSSALLPEGQGRHHIRAYDVVDGRYCKNGRDIAAIRPGVADGFRVDVSGNIWTSSRSGVQVIAPDAVVLGVLAVEQQVINLCFGGSDDATVYFTVPQGLYRVGTRTRGQRFRTLS